MISISVGKASKWALTLNYDWTNVQEIVTVDPKYNPLEALVYGDIKYFTGERNRKVSPSFIKINGSLLNFLIIFHQLSEYRFCMAPYRWVSMQQWNLQNSSAI